MAGAAEVIPDLVKFLELGGIWVTAIIALILPVLYRPKLKLVAKSDGIGSSTYFPAGSVPSAVQELWLKLGVTNRSGLNAEDVQVRLIVTRRRDVAGRGGYQVFSSWWLKVSALPLTEISIPPKYIQYVDLCYLVAGSAPALYLVGVRAPVREWDQERAAIEAEPKLRLDPNVQYDILLAVAGRNTHASYWRVGLSWQLPTSSRPASLGEDDVRAAVKLSEPRRVARFLELEDIETLSRALSD